MLVNGDRVLPLKVELFESKKPLFNQSRTPQWGEQKAEMWTRIGKFTVVLKGIEELLCKCILKSKSDETPTSCSLWMGEGQQELMFFPLSKEVMLPPR